MFVFKVSLVIGIVCFLLYFLQGVVLYVREVDGVSADRWRGILYMVTGLSVAVLLSALLGMHWYW